MAMVLSAFASILANRLIDLAKEEVDLILGVPGEIRKLQRTIQKIQHVLTDAERRMITDEGINDWLKELKDVMYDADDILDECRIEAEKCGQPSSPKSTVCCRFPRLSCFREVAFTYKIGTRVKDLNQRLEEISSQRSNFDLKISSERVTSRVSRKTSPVVESDIVGRKIDEDTNKLVEWLTKEDTRGNVLVLAIVGIGGIGKTTLAQKVFQDQKIKANFRTTLWVCVSQEFIETDLLKEIITSAGGSHGGAQSRALLEPLVANLVRGNKFLLVLDDVWSEQIWEDLLRNPLQSGAAGSRVLVTTRNEGIARRMKAINIHQMELLPPEDCWSLLCKKVGFSEEEGDIQCLKDIGMKIIHKCDGLPLAIKTIGGVLCSRGASRRAWEEVLQSTSWSLTGLPEGVKGALYLSYEDLPSHLKQCFLYCALFPEDYIHVRRYLVQFWIAEGLVEAEGDLTMEATGAEYFRELVRRSLLQPEPNFYDQCGCRMHDLLRSLAHFLARDESLAVRNVRKGSSSAAAMKLRRLSVISPEGKGLEPILSVTKSQESLRTLLLERTELDEMDIDEYLKNLTRLRVLHIAKTRIKILPHYIGNMKHLRYLDLSDCQIRELPESIGDLVNLEFLILERCRMRKLPQGVVKLLNLRSLDLDGVPVEELPSGIGRLQHLNVLQGFVVHSNDNEHESGWCTLEEMSTLSKLKHLTINKLERAWAEVEARREATTLKDNQHLEWLDLHCTPCKADGRQAYGYAEEEIRRIEDVFGAALSPPPSLDQLRIENYFGLRYPSWMTSSSIGSLLPNLRRLDLIDCNLCTQLPPLGKLPNLGLLCIEGATAITTIGPEFLGCNIDSGSVPTRRGMHWSSSPILFPKLTTLVLKRLPNWEKWQWEVEDEIVAMPCLNSLYISECPKLSSLPEGLSHHATALTCLSLYNVGDLRSLKSFFSVKELYIYNNSSLETVSDLPALKVLVLASYAMRSLPGWFVEGAAHFTALQKLDIRGSSQLLQRCLLDGVDWPKINHVPIVYVHDNRSNYITYTKSPFTFNTNL